MAAPDNVAPIVVNPDHTFNSGVVNVTTSLAGLVKLQGCRGRRLLLECIVGAGGALAHFQIGRAAVPGGDEIVFAADAAFNTPGNEILGAARSDGASPPNVYACPAGDSFHLHLDGGADEYEFYVQGAAATTIKILGTAYRVGQ